jgi:L-alanine-DL-glutamate epimerase-like enolase superfamily enzyme
VQKTAFHANLGRKAVDVSACIFIVVTETARVGEAHKTGINIAASLHFVAALPNTHYFEYCVEQGALRQTLTKQRFPVVDGDICVPEEPGLGIELDEEVVARYRVG